MTRSSPLRHAYAQRDEARAELEAAKLSHMGASAILSSTLIAEHRLQQVVRLIQARHPAGIANARLASQYAAVLYSTAHWSLMGDPAYTVGPEDTPEAIRAKAKARRETARADAVARYPGLAEQLRGLAHFERFTNAAAGRLLAVTWQEIEMLDLTMLGASDITAEEYEKRKADRRRNKQCSAAAAKRREQGKPTAEVRQAKAQMEREALKRLADQHAVSVKTIRRRVAAGIIADPRCPTRIAAIYNTGDATGTNLSTRDGRASGASVTPHKSLRYPPSELFTAPKFTTHPLKERGASGDMRGNQMIDLPTKQGTK